MGRIRFGALFVFLSAGALLGCSQEGSLVVKNDCQTEFEGYVDNRLVEIAPGDQVSMSVYIGKKALMIGPNDIPVEISGSALTKKPFVESIVIGSDETTIYSIVDDVGALIFQNAHNLQINNISVKNCDSLEFDEGLLTKNQVLSPGTSKLIQLGEGCWDILVDYGRESLLDTVTGIPGSIGQIIRISWVPGYVYVPPGRAAGQPR